jgi:hypothetical protein
MPRQSSLAFIPLLTLYILALTYLSPSAHGPFAQAHPFPSAKTENDNSQRPFSTHHRHPHSPYGSPVTILTEGQELPDETFSLRHLLHRGGSRYPDLFRRMDLEASDIQRSELLSGQSLVHQVKVKGTTTLKPRDQSYRNQGFRSFDTSIGPESWTKEVVPAPDVTDKESVLQLSKMNYNSYTEVASPGWYDLEGNWSVVSYPLFLLFVLFCLFVIACSFPFLCTLFFFKRLFGDINKNGTKVSISDKTPFLHVRPRFCLYLLNIY